MKISNEFYNSILEGFKKIEPKQIERIKNVSKNETQFFWNLYHFSGISETFKKVLHHNFTDQQLQTSLKKAANELNYKL